MVGFPNNHGVFLLKMISTWEVLGVPPFEETPISTVPPPKSLLMSKGGMEMKLHTMVDDAKLILVLYPQIPRDPNERQNILLLARFPRTLSRAFLAVFLGGDSFFCHVTKSDVALLFSRKL